MGINEELYLDHYGTKGMRWGVITKSKNQKRYEKDVASAAKQVKNNPNSKVTIKGHPRYINTKAKDGRVKTEMSGKQFTDSLMSSFGGTSLRKIKRGESALWKQHVDRLINEQGMVPSKRITKLGPESRISVTVKAKK